MIGLSIYLAGAILAYYIFVRLATQPPSSEAKITITDPRLAAFPLWQVGIVAALFWPVLAAVVLLALVAPGGHNDR